MKRNYIIMLLLMVAMLPASMKAQNCDITLPWSQDFEGLATNGNSFAPCWTRVDSCLNGSAICPNIYGFGSTQGNVMNFNGNGVSTGSGTMRAATPRIPAPLNSLELSFVVYKSTLNLYLATNPSDQSTYVLVGSYAPGYVWTTYEVRTDTVTSAPADTGYLVFTGAYGSGYSNGNAYLDDLYVSELNPCQRTLEVVAERVGVTTALLSWPDAPGAVSYNVSYDTNADMSNAITEQVFTGSILISGLDPNTHYYVSVTTVCGDNSESDPRTTEFTTQLSCYSIVNLRQVSMSSDAAAFEWDYDVRGNAADGVVTILHDLSDSLAVDYEELSNGDNYHFFSGLDNTHEYQAIFRTICGADTSELVSDIIMFRRCGETELAADTNDWSNDHPLVPFYNYSYSQMMYPASALYDMDTIRGIALRRHVRTASVTTTRTLSLWLGHSTGTTFAAPQSVTGMTQVANSVSYVLENQEWDTLMFTTPFLYDGTSNVIVTIVDNTGTHTSSSANPYWLWHDSEWQMHYVSNDDNAYNAVTPPSSTSHRDHLPDMRFIGMCNDENICEAPVMAVVATDTSSIEIDWTAGSGFVWTVQYRTIGSSAWTTVSGINIMPYTITGLLPDTRYEVRIGVDCNGQMRYSRAVLCATECAIQHIPFNFTQDDLTGAVENGGFSDCWSFSSDVRYGKLTFSHRAYLRNVGNGQWIMLPAVAEHLSGARLRTWAAVSSASLVRVGIASESNCSDVVWLDTIELPGTNPNTDVNEYISYFDGYEGTGNRVVLSPVVDNEFSYVYFFDFHIEMAEGCRPIVGLTLDNADSNSLSFHWTPVGSASQWLIYVDGVEHGIANSPNYTVTGLNPYTEYDITVRTFCGEGDTSYARSATFLTGCDGVSCTFTVNAVSSTHNGWNGGLLQIMSGSREIGLVRMNNGSTMSRTFMVCGGMPLTFNWLSGNADSVCSFTIVDGDGNTLYNCLDATYLDSGFFALDSLCGEGGDEPGPGPNPGGIDEAANAAVTIAPNPASGKVTIVVAGKLAVASVSIVDVNGREVARCQQFNGLWALDVSDMAKGAYFVRIVGDSTALTRKLIVR